MARESCNLDKEEAELHKPSSPSSARAAAASLFLKPAAQRTLEAPAATGDPGAAAAACGLGKSGGRQMSPPGRSSVRCSSCARRVGLTGFRCRCGDLFCARHRHAGVHDCSFDYKAAGREEISRANPLVRASKILKI